MKKKNVKIVLPRPEYESPYESTRYNSSQEDAVAKEENEGNEVSVPQREKEDHLHTSLYESPYETPEEKMERVYRVGRTPTCNPVVKKTLEKKRANSGREEYQSPFQTDAHSNKSSSTKESDPLIEEEPSLYQSPYEQVKKERGDFEVNEEYDSFDLPFIETRVTSEIRGSRVMDLAFEHANMDAEQQEASTRHMRQACCFLVVSVLLLIVLLILNLPPKLRIYQGELGTYEVYHFQKLIVTPQGEEITYARKTYQKAMYYSFFMPDGEEVRTTSLHEGVQIHVGRQSLLTQQERDLYDAMIIVEEDYREAGDSYQSKGILPLIQVYHTALGIFFVVCPFYLIDFAVFCYPANSPQYHSMEFLKKCRGFALGYAVFSITPWGGNFHLNLILNSMGVIINQWAGILHASVGG